jgi:retron-type reverse transcriptase
MKNKKKLFPKLFSTKNIFRAYKEASKNKNFRKANLLFEKRLALNLKRIQNSLKTKTYSHGNYKFFKIYDQKEREISAAPLKDRIVHHAVYQIIEPIFNKIFIFDSFANRKGKGSHRAVKRLQYFIKKTKNKHSKIYCLKCDISKCFPSINQEILLKLIQKRITDPDIIWLIKIILRSFKTNNQFDHLFNPNSPFIKNKNKGIPIGNLTSQLFVNIYLDPLDKFVKHQVKAKYYLRYVDDFIILHPSKKFLHQSLKKIEDFLNYQLYLELHPKKQAIFPIEKGVDFLGFVVFEKHCFLRKSNKEKFRKNLIKMKKLYLTGKIDQETAVISITSWLAHCQHANTDRLRRRIFGKSLKAKDQEEIAEFVNSWKNQPIREPSGQLRLF